MSDFIDRVDVGDIGALRKPKTAPEEGPGHRCDAHELDESQQASGSVNAETTPAKTKKQADEAPACTPVTKPIRDGQPRPWDG